MKNIIKSFLVIVAVAAIAGGVTYALWSDEAKVAGVTASSGTMDLKIDQNMSPGGKDWVDGFDITSWDFRQVNGGLTVDEVLETIGLKNLYPGKVASQSIGVLNEGDADGKVTIQLKRGAYNKLADNLKIYISYGDDLKRVGILNDMHNNVYDLGSLGVEDEGDVDIKWEMLSSAGNDTQELEMPVEIILNLVQTN